MDYDLSGLSSRTFERLVQSLAAKILGPGIVIFGDGPDGGREATFEGTIPFPTKTRKWNGYGVVQAKFLQRPRNTKADTTWLLQEVEKELKAYKRNRRKPKYFICATNVVLSGVSRRGGKDRLDTLFKKYKDKTGISDWRIWDYDQLTTYLDDAADIRRAYGAWVTAGDVLGPALQALTSTRPDFADVMATFLSNELLADQFANLDQAGHATEDKIPLSHVFVDLPVTGERMSEPPPDSGANAPLDFLNHVVEIAKERLDPVSLEDDGATTRGNYHLQRGSRTGRYVLIGGPGQGKTTLSQFVCQLFRAALLRTKPRPRLSAETKAALQEVISQCDAETLVLPGARRFPIRIVLSEFAKALSLSGGPTTLLEYIAQVIKRRTGRPVMAEDLRQWLRDYPWIIILDGLDEVPASSNRGAVLDAVRSFGVDAAQLNADLVLIATTRPQGYADDFSPKHYRHLWLAPLSEARALRYASRFVGVRYSSDSDRQLKIKTRLEHAIGQESTARLMRSPLLVTIMATLVDQIGRPPQDRWRLFHDYYDVIYRREMERDIPAADLLREHRTNLDAIHSRVGLALQLASERSGGTEARLTADRFGAIVAERLGEEGFAGSELAKLKERIIEAAANRLVFLVGVEEGRVGFEIRSLQEFMAAEALMAGDEKAIDKRLRRIAPAIGWRNVFLFAAGRCFSEAQHMRPHIYTIASQLNEDLAKDVGAATRAGSVLALELLEDGLPRRAPKFAKLFARLALRLIEMPPTDLQTRLAEIYDVDIEALFREEIEGRLAGGGSTVNLGAWAVVVTLAARGVAWAEQLTAQRWPSDLDAATEILEMPTGRRTRSWLAARANAVAAAISPGRAWRFLVNGDRDQGRPKTVVEVLRQSELLNRAAPNVRIRFADSREGWPATLHGLRDTERAASGVSLDGAMHPGWAPIREGVRLARDPSKEALAKAIEACAEPSALAMRLRHWRLCPWVLGTILDACKTPEEARAQAATVRRGGYGDSRDWEKAEARWSTQGITEDDIRHVTPSGRVFDSDVATIGCPGGAVSVSPHRMGPVGDGPAAVRLFASLPRSAESWRFVLSEGVLGTIGWHDSVGVLSEADPKVLAEMIDSANLVTADSVVLAISNSDEGRDWLPVLQALGRQRFLYTQRVAGLSDRFARGAEVIADLVLTDPSRTDVLRVLATVLEFVPPSTHLQLLKVLRLEDDAVLAKFKGIAAIGPITLLLATRRRSMKSLAEATLQASHDARRGESEARVLEEVVEAVDRMGLFDVGGTDYVLELLKLADRYSEASLVVLGALNSALQQRPSGLDDERVWNDLALPHEPHSSAPL